VQVYDELSGCKMDVILRKRAILPRRFGGVVPGISPVVEAAYVASAMQFEAFVNEHGNRRQQEPAIPVSRDACPVGYVTGPAASALAAVGGDMSVELHGYESRPAPFHELGRARGKQRDLANFLWVAYFNELFQAADNRNRMLLAEGATAGSGLFLQGIPSVSHFRFSPQVMRTQVKALLGVSPAPSEPWTHSCGGGNHMELQGKECSHLYHCSQQFRALGTHDAVSEQVQDTLLDAGYGNGWHVERTPVNPGTPPTSAPGGPICSVMIPKVLLSWWMCP